MPSVSAHTQEPSNKGAIAQQIAHRLFGYDVLRDAKREVLLSLLKHQDTLVVMPTAKVGAETFGEKRTRQMQ